MILKQGLVLRLPETSNKSERPDHLLMKKGKLWDWWDSVFAKDQIFN